VSFDAKRNARRPRTRSTCGGEPTLAQSPGGSTGRSGRCELQPALHLEIAGHGASQALRDGKPQSGATLPARERHFDLLAPAERCGKRLGGNADAGISTVIATANALSLDTAARRPDRSCSGDALDARSFIVDGFGVQENHVGIEKSLPQPSSSTAGTRAPRRAWCKLVRRPTKR
jgi:hypothetical protein